MPPFYPISEQEAIMKKIIASLFLLCLSIPVLAADEASLDSEKQKASYAVGLQIGQSLLRQGVDLDGDAFLQAIKDVYTQTPPRLSREELQAVLTRQSERIVSAQKEVAQKNLDAGTAFLTENRKQEGLIELKNGLQYIVVKEGNGDKPAPKDTVVVHYRGTHIDGTEFDSSYKRNEPATLPLNGVIPGWQEALTRMPVGSRWRIFVPANLAYGARGAGAAIGPNETLVFDVELLEIKK